MVSAKKKSKDDEEGKSKSSFLGVLIFLGKVFWFIIRIPYFIIKYLYLFGRYLYFKLKPEPKVASTSHDDHESTSFTKGSLRDITNTKKKKASFNVLNNLKGEFDDFLEYLKKNDSFIAITIGARGSGKTATSLAFMEVLRDSKKNCFAMGFSREALPNWIYLVENISDIENDSLVVVDEGGILFSSRSSMSDSNKFLSELLMIARHKNISIIFISQNSSNLEINTLRQADVLILKKHSLLQKNFERKIIAKLYDDYEIYFTKYKSLKGTSLVFSDQFVGFLDVSLPSFWSDKTSKSFGKIDTQDKDSKTSKK